MTETSFGTELKSKLLSGVKKLNDSVSSTLGPAGRTVLIKGEYGQLTVTKDGVSVAKAFKELEDPIESTGAELVQKVSVKSANEVGDGTTTGTLLTYAILEEGLKHVTAGQNAVEIKKGIDAAVNELKTALNNLTEDISDNQQIKEVATISGNNDEEIGNLIATALEKVGRDGVVAIEESKSGETSLEIVEGMQFDRGYKSPYFVTDNNTMTATLDSPYILIYNGRIGSVNELVNALTIANSETKSLLIVAEDIDGEALALTIVNKMRGVVNVVAVKAPDFGDRRTMALEDLAIITGGQVLSKDKGHKLDKIDVATLKQCMGTARTATIGKDKTTIVDGKGEEEAITARAEEIKVQIDNANSPFEKEKLQERLGKLIGGVAIINVGGNSELEIREKKDRVEDALFATKAALEEGIVVGGGTALLYARKSITFEGSNDFVLGKKIVYRAVAAPFQKILTNAGHDIVEVQYLGSKLTDSEKGNNWAGLNYKDLSTIDFKEAGIIDPKKVTRIALENAASVAGTILTTESVIYERKEDKEEQNSQQGMM
ncbi:chaperonin GroEL [Candidatus Pelagibacter sp.]|nr:chaperonin GroEL [Candidatus Pelagibacter sp.]